MSVTVMIGGDKDELRPVFDCAIDLTKRMKTTLKGLCALPDPANSVVYITGAETVVMGSAAIASLTEAQENLVKEYKQVFAEYTTDAGSWLKADFTMERGSVASRGAAANLMADAFIVPHEATQSNHPLNPVFEHVLMEANLPLVLAPKSHTPSDTCVIAWDGSPLAARTVKMHMPLIASYKTVVIAQHAKKVRHQWAHVSGPSKEHLAEVLREQRLEVTYADLDGPVSQALEETAKAHNASLIVMGAYGHTRIGELLFGGTTSKLLHSESAPALALCH